MLTKDQLHLLNEAAVEWEKSALGILTNSIFRPISWLKGSIKKGLKKQQMEILVKQYGMEFVKALKEVDTGKKEPETPTNTPETTSTEVQSNEDNTGLVKNLILERDYLKKLDNKVLKKCLDITIDNLLNSDPTNQQELLNKYNSIQKEINSIKGEINIEALVNIINKSSLTDQEKKEDIDGLNITKNKIIEFINFIKNKENKLQDYKDKYNEAGKNTYTKNIQGIAQLVSDLIEQYNNYIVESNNSKKTKLEIGKEYIFTNDKGIKSKVLLLSLDNQISAGPDKKFLTDDDIDETDLEEGEVYVEFVDNKKRQSVLAIKLSEIQKESYKTILKYIKEASEYTLPGSITNLISEEELDQLKNIENIKEKTLQSLNFIRLDSITYEANTIIERSKQSNTKDKEDQAIVLQKIWDQGVNNTHDYFQNVFDINKVKGKVKGKVDPNTQKTILNDQNNLDELQILGATEIIEVGKKLDINKLYAFKCLLEGDNKKKESYILFLSPTKDYIDKAKVDDKNYYWFRLFGGYKIDKNTKKIERINIFNKLVSNQEMKKQFENEGTSYYVCLRNLRPTNTMSYMYVYSNQGNIFFNNKIEKNINVIKNTIDKSDTIEKTVEKNITILNILKISIIQRFGISEEDVKANKYPGIDMNKLTTDPAENNAQVNHQGLLKIIN